MKTIWKFILEITGEQTVEMPKRSKVLTAQMQHGALCVWALCDPEAAKEKRVFTIAGTGHPIDEGVGREYVGTAQMEGGHLVWHVFVNPVSQ